MGGSGRYSISKDRLIFLVLTISSVRNSTLNHQIVSAISSLEILDILFPSPALVLVVSRTGPANLVELWPYIDVIF